MPSLSMPLSVQLLIKSNKSTLDDIVNVFEAEAKESRSHDKSLDTPKIDILYQLPIRVLISDTEALPTFKLELEVQEMIDYIWSRISNADEKKLHKEHIKKLKKKRLEDLPVQQLRVVGQLLDQFPVSRCSRGHAALKLVGSVREKLLAHLSSDVHTHAICWAIGLLAQTLYMPLGQMFDIFNEAQGLSDFLSKVPRFRVCFDVTNKGGNMLEYIRQHIDPRLDIIQIGMSTNNITSWYEISKHCCLQDFLMRYAVVKGISSIRSFILTYNGNRLFLSDGSVFPSDIGLKDGDVISVSLRPQGSSTERAPLKQINKDNKHKSAVSNGRKNRNRKSGRRKKSIQHLPEEDEESKHKQIWLHAISKVQEEARPRFDKIRQDLNSMNLERMPPKAKSKNSHSLQLATTISNLPMGGLAGKAGISCFAILVGEAENLHKTPKRSGGRRPKCCREVDGAMIDLHGLTKVQALEKLDESLPGWMDMAMKKSYPFVIRVKIVCGGGNQILSGEVKNWIRQNKNVLNAPKTKRLSS